MKPVDDVNPANVLGGDETPKPDATAKKTEEEPAQGPEYKLLRYFDFDVEPDKEYAYRVFLLLCNPNHKLPANVLEEGELARDPILGLGPNSVKMDGKGNLIAVEINEHYAHWSPSCLSGRMSGGMRILGGPVVAAKGPMEINAELRVLRWLEKTGLNGCYSPEGLVRGTVLNFPRAPMKTPGGGKSTGPLATNCILVDLFGGEPLFSPKDRSCFNPGLMLVMDESGNLVMHDEVADSKEWDSANKPPAKPQQPSVRGTRQPRTPGRGQKPVDNGGLNEDDVKSKRGR